MNEQNQQATPEQTIAIQSMQLQAVARQRDEANNKLAATEATLGMVQNQIGFLDAVLGKFKAADETVFNEKVAEVQEEMKAKQSA